MNCTEKMSVMYYKCQNVAVLCAMLFVPSFSSVAVTADEATNISPLDAYHSTATQGKPGDDDFVILDKHHLERDAQLSLMNALDARVAEDINYTLNLDLTFMDAARSLGVTVPTASTVAQEAISLKPSLLGRGTLDELMLALPDNAKSNEKNTVRFLADGLIQFLEADMQTIIQTLENFSSCDPGWFWNGTTCAEERDPFLTLAASKPLPSNTGPSCAPDEKLVFVKRELDLNNDGVISYDEQLEGASWQCTKDETVMVVDYNCGSDTTGLPADMRKHVNAVCNSLPFVLTQPLDPCKILFYGRSTGFAFHARRVDGEIPDYETLMPVGAPPRSTYIHDPDAPTVVMRTGDEFLHPEKNLRVRFAIEPDPDLVVDATSCYGVAP